MGDVDGGIRMPDGSWADDKRRFPIRREKRDRNDYHGPRPGPGQTVMLCPTESRMMLFKFCPLDLLECIQCGFHISREEATS